MADNHHIVWYTHETDLRCIVCDGRITHRAINVFAERCENGHEVTDLERLKYG